MLISRLIFVIVFLIFIYPQNIKADTRPEHFDDGAAAYKKGDYKTAVKEFNEAAKTGDYRAMYALGSMYFEGIGVDKDNKKAYRWFKEAAGYNSLRAEYKLGLMYDEGIGVSQNFKKAARLYNKGATRGFASAQFGLGMLYTKGHGVKQNNVKAYAWLVVAGTYFSNVIPEDKEEAAETKQATDESEKAVKLLDKRLDEEFAAKRLDLINVELKRIRKELTPEQLEETKQLVQTYSKYREKHTVVNLRGGRFTAEDLYIYLPPF